MRSFYLGILLCVGPWGCADLVEGDGGRSTDGNDDDNDDDDSGASSVTPTGTLPTSSSTTGDPPTTGENTMGLVTTGDGTSDDAESSSTVDPTLDPTTSGTTEGSSSTGAPLDPKFADCFNLGEDVCEDGETCIYDHPPSTASAACMQTDCSDSSECPDAPPGGEAEPTCGQVATTDGDECYLDCSGGEACPTGMVCVAERLCLWPQQGMAEQGFNPQIPQNWTLYDEDGRTPETEVSFVDEAWVASDYGGPWAAVSTSWYSPAGAADDWLVTPPIAISDGSEISFRATALDPDFPDGYQVRISTATNSVSDFLANPALLTVDEEQVGAWNNRTIDLAAEGYADQIIYLAWRNTSDDMFVLLVDNIAVSY